MKKFIQAARRARQTVKKQYVRELTYELLWIGRNPEWDKVLWEDFYRGKRSGEIMIEESLKNELKNMGIKKAQK